MGPKPKAAADECVRVVVRARPFNKREKDLKCKSVIDVDVEADTIRIQKPDTEGEAGQKAFVFDAVYNEHSTQRGVYDETAAPLVESVLGGYNGTIFAYGQTGCGKTFSMEGFEEPKELRGIIPNAFDHIFDVVDADESSRQYLIRASYLEIYNEEVRDLLGEDPVKRCDLKENPEKGVFVKGLTTGIVKSAGEIDGLMKAGNKNRSVGATLMNQSSSRSHSIFTVTIETSEEKTDSKGKKSASIKVGKLNLVDLAGSERQSKTQASGDRFKEATKINLSLSALGNVIAALVDGKSKHIPYRDSKLTRLLQDSLGGNTKTVMVAAISPADNNYDETMSTLRYANRAKNIKNKPKINEDPKDALLREFQEEIERLRAALEAQQRGEPVALPENESKEKSPIKRMKSHAKLEKQGSMAFLESAKGEEMLERESALVRTAKEIEEEQSKLKAKEELLQLQQQEIRNREKEMADERLKVEQKAKEMSSKEAELQEHKDRLALESEEKAKKLAAAIKEKDEIAKKQLEKQLQDLNAEKEALATATEEAHKAKGTLQAQLEEMQSMVHSGEEAAKEAANRAAAAEKAAAAAKRNEGRERRRAEMKLKKQKAKEELLRNEMEYLVQDQEMEKQEAAYLEDQVEMNEQLIKRHKKKLRNLQSEITDLTAEFQTEREWLLGQIRDQTKEMGLLEQIVSLFVPPVTLQRIEKRARFDEETGEWSIPQDLIRDRPTAAANLKLPTMDRAASAPRQRRGSIAIETAIREADMTDQHGVGVKLSDMGGLESLNPGQSSASQATVSVSIVPSASPADEVDGDAPNGRMSQNSIGGRPSSGAGKRALTTATATPPHLRYIQEMEGRKRSASTCETQGPALRIPKGPPTKKNLLGQAPRASSAVRRRSDLNSGLTPSLPGLGKPEAAPAPEKRASGASDSPFMPIQPPSAPVKKDPGKRGSKSRNKKPAVVDEEAAYLDEGFEEEPPADPEEQAYLEEGFEEDPEAPKSKRQSTSKHKNTSEKKGRSHPKKPSTVPSLNLGKAALDKAPGISSAVKKKTPKKVGRKKH